MTSTDVKSVERRGAGPTSAPPPSPRALRRSTAIRVIVAMLGAAAITTAAILAEWGPLHVTTDVVGYPVFADFNAYNYYDAYYLAIGLFPVATLAIFYGLTWLGPRVRLPIPPSRGRLRPPVGVSEADPLEGPPPAAVNRRVAAVARVALVGAVLGIEIGVAANHTWPSIVLVAGGYALVVSLASAALGRLMLHRPDYDTALRTVNSLGAVVTLAGLALVSSHTGVRILSANAVHPYPWLPAWLAIVVAAALAGWVVVSLRRAERSAIATIEWRSVFLIALPVGLFVLYAHLPGDVGLLSLFEEGQPLAEATLLGHGWLPWRDVVLTHGLLGDVAPAAAGWAVFGNSYWGAFAGLSLILYPLAVVATYWLLAFLVRGSWPLVLIAAFIFLGSWLGTTDPRFVSWPLILLLLAVTLKHRSRMRAAGLGVLVVAQAIATFEMSPAVLAVILTVAAYDWYWQPAGAPLTHTFRRTIWLLVGIIVSAGLFLIYMATRGAVGDVVYISVNLITGHLLDGAIPPQAAASGVSAARFDFVALAPVAALLISFGYAVVRLRLRRPFRLADWPMGAAALFLVVYYPKFLARMDYPHAVQPFMVATPLMLYIVYRAVSAIDRWIQDRARRGVPRGRFRWLPASPVAVLLLIGFLVAFWGPFWNVVGGAPANYRSTSPAPAQFARVGYSSQVDAPALEDLTRIITAYLRPQDRLLDITDEPALFHYFIQRFPASRWYAPNGLVDTAELQRDVLASLRRSPPKLIVFDDTDLTMYGLPVMDGISASARLYLISRWILEHYRPLLVTHGRTIYALPSVRPIPIARLHLKERPATTEVRFLGQSCNWGFAPTFLGAPAEPGPNAQTVPTRITATHGPEVTFTGWAGDLRAQRPAREVIATFDGRIIARARPNGDRPDVPKAGFPAGFEHSGFRLSIPTSANATNALRIFAIGRDGSVAQLPVPGAPRQSGPARIGKRSVTLQPKADAGGIDGSAASGAFLQIAPPAGSTWGDYRWLEVDAPGPGGFVAGGFTLSDRSDTDTSSSGHVISFATLQRSPHRYIVPVSSCQQWDGYGSRRLFLTPPAGQRTVGVSLIR